MFNSHTADKSKLKRSSFYRNNSLPILLLGILVLTVSSALAYAETIAIDVDGNSFDVDYSAIGVTLSGAEADLDFISLILDVSVTGSTGTLDITFDRTFFDSKFEGADDPFIILADGDEPNFTETETTSESRTLSIEVPSGTEEIEIIGSVFGDSAPVIVVETPEPIEEAPEPIEEAPEPIEEAPEPIEEAPEPIEEAPEPIEEAPEPIEEAPEPIEEAPEPIEEAPEPIEEAPKIQCGPGTTLQDGVCVLDERCGPGTVLQDGVCVLKPTTPVSTTTDISVQEMGKELVLGVIVAFVVAGIIGIILGLISKASKSKD
ncbi:hypothetical protein [Nitrosopumilus sp.]|uniref:hypothetical protein n=1 Tax=Nitrosopumilus sp. TaxID=2024843 RepID=UPI00292E2DB8|nr:hypothetical protein [Nitrosopumilus sp.]